MKRFLYFVIFLLTAQCVQSQTITQKGVTYRYNGKNKRTPIGGVYIKAITANNSEVSNEKTGAFELAFDNLKMGSRIGNVRVTKQGMMVFNQQAVDEWSVRKDPLCLILCDANEFQKQKKNLIAIGESQAKKKYNKKLAELEIQNNTKQLKIDAYYNKLDSLEKEYQNALKHMDEYADVFARIDESEVDTVTQRAIEMFKQGEIEESMRLLEQQNYMEKIKQANRTIEQAEAMISTGEQAKSLAEQDKEKYIEGVKTQIAGYKLQNEWDKAKELLKGLADNLNTLSAIMEYAAFCYHQNDYKEAEVYLLTFEAAVHQKEEMEETEKLGWIAYVQNGLGLIYSQTQQFSESEEMYKEAIAIHKRLTEVNSLAFEPELAMSYNNLGNLYYSVQRFKESEEMHKTALTIRERLAQDNPQEFEPDLAMSHNNLGNLYYSVQRFSESEEMYKAAIAILERLAKSNPQAYEPDLTASYNNLGNLYCATQRFSESEEMHKSALAIRERLAKDNPQAYEPNLARSYHNLANLYTQTHRFTKSEEMHRAAIAIFEELVKANPQAYEHDLAASYNNLAILCYYTQHLSESEEKFKAALAIHERLAKDDPQAYEPELAMSYNNLGNLYSDIQRFDESEEMYKAAIAIRERLAQDNPQAYEPGLADSYYNLADLYYNTQRFSESEAMYKSAIAVGERLAKNNPLIYEYERVLMSEYYWLGKAMLKLEKYHEALESYKQSLHLARKQIKAGKDTPLYWKSLYSLSCISSIEKDYASVYTYNEELLPLLHGLYQGESDKYQADYSSQLVSQSFNANLLGKFQEGEQYSLEALKVDSTEHIAYTNLAAALLLQGKLTEAEKLYQVYKPDFKDSFLSDFAEFERLGVIPEERKKDVERIKAMLNEE